jgi:sec-independent protein translocase protein TatB
MVAPSSWSHAREDGAITPVIAARAVVGYPSTEACMPGLDFTELLLIGILILLFVGPERMPHIVRNLGRLYGQLRRSADELRKALVLEADRMDEEERLRALVRQRKEAEAKRQAESGETAVAGAQAQPQPEPIAAPQALPPADTASAGVAVSSEAVPEGFSADEWQTLPESVKLLVRQRQAVP